MSMAGILVSSKICQFNPKKKNHVGEVKENFVSSFVFTGTHVSVSSAVVT